MYRDRWLSQVSGVHGLHYAKRSLMSVVVVWPRPTLEETNFSEKKRKEKSRCHTKRRAGAATRARPSFGMTTTQDIRDLFT